MLKYTIIFAYLFSSSLSTYRAMSKKSIDFGNDICFYRETDDSSDYLYYVKPCPDGQYCSYFEGSDYYLSKCQTYSQLKTTLNGNCQTDFECGNDYSSGIFDLECTGSNEKHCTVKSSSIFTIEDSVSNEKKYFCHPDKVAMAITNANSSPGNFGCISVTSTQKSQYGDKYFFTLTDDSDGSSYDYYIAPGLYKVPGKINFKTKQNNADYIIDNIETSYIGSQTVETFVKNGMACETGFALNFYGNGQLVEPTDSSPSHSTHLYCVNVKEVDSVNRFIKYTLKDDVEKIYNCNKGSSISCSATLMTKLEMFKNYKEKLDSIRSECETSNYDEPFTCGNNELRKWWYFYNNPDEYILYKDEKEIIDFLVQRAYPGYTPENNSRFLNLKYFFYLLLLIAL